MKKLLALAAALAWLGFAADSPAQPYVQYTYTGSVTFGTDWYGVFTQAANPHGNSLAGAPFTMAFEMNLADGRLIQNPSNIAVVGGTIQDGYPTPIVNAILTINGVSVAVDGGWDAQVDTSPPGGQNAFAMANLSGDSVYAAIASPNLPFSLSTPVALYTAVPSDTVSGSFSIGQGSNGNGTLMEASGALAPSTLSVAVVDGFSPVAQAYVTGTLGSNGWYVSPVSVVWNVTGIPTPTTSGCAPASVADTKGVTLPCSATNALGAASQSLVVKEDTVAPSVSVKAPRSGARYRRGAAVAASFKCKDATSGVASCVGSTADGSDVPTSKRGSYSFQVVGTDYAGNVTTKTLTYSVD